jgi:hypothetical protein
MAHTIDGQRLACLIGKRRNKIAIGIANKFIRRNMIFRKTELFTAFLLEQELKTKFKNLVLFQNFAAIITFKNSTNYVRNKLAKCRVY